MAQPFFNNNYGSLMRVDNSGIQQAGQAYGQMFESLGKTIGSTIEKFREGKEKKEQQQRSEDLFLRLYETNSDNPIFSALSIQSTEEAKAVAKDISKDPKLVADAMKFAQMQMDQQKRNQANELYDRTIAADERKIADRQREVNFDRFMAGKGQPGQKAPALIANPRQFQRRANEMDVDPGLMNNRLMELQKQKIESAKENTGKLGDQFSSRVGALEPYFFSESDATNAVSNEATKLGINLNKDQLAQSVSKQKIISTKDLRSAADTRFSKLNLDEPRTVLEAADDLEAFLTEGNPLSSSVAKEKLARMVQPKGILTEDDLKRMGGSQAFIDRFQSFIEQQKTGTLDPKLKKYLEETTAVFRKRAQEVLMEKTDYTVKSLAKNFEITPEEVRKYTQFGGIMYGFDQPSNQSPPQVQPPQDPGGPEPIELSPGGPTFTPIPQ